MCSVPSNNSSSSCRYIGNWSKDKRTGKGELHFANGDKYEGEWLDDKKHGKGVYFYAHGRIRHESWQHGNKVEDPRQKYSTPLDVGYDDGLNLSISGIQCSHYWFCVLNM